MSSSGDESTDAYTGCLDVGIGVVASGVIGAVVVFATTPEDALLASAGVALYAFVGAAAGALLRILLFLDRRWRRVPNEWRPETSRLVAGPGALAILAGPGSQRLPRAWQTAVTRRRVVQ